MLRRAAIPVLLFCALAIPACTADPIAQDTDDLTGDTRTIEVDRLLDDEQLEGGQGITASEVQAFLEKKKSALATYEDGDRSAAQLIVEESRAEHISPLYMLTRIETESGLVSSGKLTNIKSATGCGCPDTARCDPQYANFGPQVRCSARMIRGYLTALDTRKVTVSGWKVGVKKSTLDPCEVTPKNRATAALYTYNPWVGAYGIGCGSSEWGGATLIPRLYNSFKTSFANPEAPNDDGPSTGEETAERGSEIFANDVYPSLEATCASCHLVGTGGAPIWFGDDAASTYTIVKGRKFQTAPSVLLEKGLHTGPALTSKQIALVEKWIGVEATQASSSSGLDDDNTDPRAPSSTSSNACAKTGTFCGGNGIAGLPEELFRCENGKATRVKTCASGCIAIPPGGEDACR